MHELAKKTKTTPHMAMIMCDLGHTVTSVAVQRCPAGPTLWISTDPESACATRGNQRSISIMWASLTASVSAVSCLSWGDGCLAAMVNAWIMGRTQSRVETLSRKSKRVSLSYVWQGSAPRVLCVCWALRNDRNAEPSALLLSGGWVVKSTVADSFPGTGLSPVWASVCKRKEMQHTFPSVVF